MYFNRALIISLLGHMVVAGFALLYSFSGGHQFLPPTIYSVTMEGGKELGGLSQVPKDEKKEPVAPPKKVAEEEPSTPLNPEEAKDEDLKPVEKIPDAEVSLSEKKKEEERKEKEKKEEKKLPPKKKEAPKKIEKKKVEPPKKTPPKERELSAAELNKQLEKAIQRYAGESTEAGGKGFGAGKIGGNSMGGGKVMSPEFFAYKRLLENHIKGAWRWFDTKAELRTQVQFGLSPQGELSDIQVISASGSREFDDSVLRAVKKANPAPIPPQSVYEFFKEVRITFDPRE